MNSGLREETRAAHSEGRGSDHAGNGNGDGNSGGGSGHGEGEDGEHGATVGGDVTATTGVYSGDVTFSTGAINVTGGTQAWALSGLPSDTTPAAAVAASSETSFEGATS